MAGSNMIFEQKVYTGDVQILKRKPFEAIPMTLDFSSVSDTDAFGNKIVKAGTPIGASGVVDNTATVVGILLHDVVESRPQGTLLKKAYINKAVAEGHSGVVYDNAVKSALPMIVFE